MKDRSHVVSIKMNGFIENVQIYYMRNNSTRVINIESNVTYSSTNSLSCKRCIGSRVEDCIECNAGYELTGVEDMSSGFVCIAVPFDYRKILIWIITLSALIFLLKYAWLQPHLSEKFKCKIHKLPGTHISKTCKHLLCADCFKLIKSQKRGFVCPICLEDINGIIKLLA